MSETCRECGWAKWPQGEGVTPLGKIGGCECETPSWLLVFPPEEAHRARDIYWNHCYEDCPCFKPRPEGEKP